MSLPTDRHFDCAERCQFPNQGCAQFCFMLPKVPHSGRPMTLRECMEAEDPPQPSAAQGETPSSIDELIQRQAKEWCAVEESERADTTDRHAVELAAFARTLARELAEAGRDLVYRQQQKVAFLQRAERLERELAEAQRIENDLRYSYAAVQQRAEKLAAQLVSLGETPCA